MLRVSTIPRIVREVFGQNSDHLDAHPNCSDNPVLRGCSAREILSAQFMWRFKILVYDKKVYSDAAS